MSEKVKTLTEGQIDTILRNSYLKWIKTCDKLATSELFNIIKSEVFSEEREKDEDLF